MSFAVITMLGESERERVAETRANPLILHAALAHLWPYKLHLQTIRQVKLTYKYEVRGARPSGLTTNGNVRANGNWHVVSEQRVATTHTIGPLVLLWDICETFDMLIKLLV